jgi:hypothetical protein
VTSEQKGQIEMVRRENPLLGRLTMPIVTEDTSFRSVFPYLMVPHVVWVGKDGRVKAITAHKFVTGDNLEKLWRGDALVLPEKKDPTDRRAFLGADPIILTNYKQNTERLLQYTYMSGYRGDVMGGATMSKMGDGTVRVKMTNATMDDMYVFAYNIYPPHKTQFICRDGLRESLNAANISNKYCYDMLVRSDSVERALTYMQHDLDRWLGLHSRKEQRMIKVLVLKENGTTAPAASKFKKHVKYEEGGQTVIQYTTTEALARFVLNYMPLKVFDGTRFKGFTDVVLPSDMNDIEAVRQALKKCGLTLEEAERKVDVVVVE